MGITPYPQPEGWTGARTVLIVNQSWSTGTVACTGIRCIGLSPSVIGTIDVTGRGIMTVIFIRSETSGRPVTRGSYAPPGVTATLCIEVTRGFSDERVRTEQRSTIALFA